MKKKILIAASNLTCGGKEKSLVSLLQAIDYHKFEVDLLLTNMNKGGDFYLEFIPKSVKILFFPDKYKWIFLQKENFFAIGKNALGINLNYLKMLFYTAKGIICKNMAIERQKMWISCSKAINLFNEKYDVAIDYTGGHKQLILDKVVSDRKISWVHSDYKVYKRDKSMDDKDYRKMDSIITISETTYNIFVKEFPQYKGKTHIIHNISDKKQIESMANQSVNFDNTYSGIKILDITRLDPNKGLNIAIQACKTLVDLGYDLKWYILGEGPERSKLEKLIKENSLTNRFILLGLQANPYPYIKKADMIVHCSLFEGKSVAIDEAMLLAKPIILTNYPTAKDQIENGINGLIADISVEGVSNKIKFLMNNESLRKELTINLQDFDLSAKASIEKLYSLIEK